MSNIESIKKTNLKIERAFKQLNKILTNSKIKEIVKPYKHNNGKYCTKPT